MDIANVVDNIVVLAAFVVSPFAMRYFFNRCLDADNFPHALLNGLAAMVAAIAFISENAIMAERLFHF